MAKWEHEWNVCWNFWGQPPSLIQHVKCGRQTKRNEFSWFYLLRWHHQLLDKKESVGSPPPKFVVIYWSSGSAAVINSSSRLKTRPHKLQAGIRRGMRIVMSSAHAHVRTKTIPLSRRVLTSSFRPRVYARIEEERVHKKPSSTLCRLHNSFYTEFCS